MITEISIIVRPEEENNRDILNKKIADALKKQNVIAPADEISAVLQKKSTDARHGIVKFCLRYKVFIGEKPQSQTESSSDFLINFKKPLTNRAVIIVGSGPAGLFCALRLLENGIKPVIIERGNSVQERKKDIAAISARGILNENSNYCFGAGGAGTFTDGKLYTRSTKRGDVSRIYKIFAAFGAPKSILTDAHPHIGTDKLPAVITKMQEKILESGGEFHLNTLCEDIIIQKSSALAPAFPSVDPRFQNIPVCAALGIKAKDLKTSQEKIFTGSAVVFATGNSADDVYKMLAKISPFCLQAASFSAGVRVEHPRALIDKIQFHGKKMPQAAEYRLATRVSGRGVYSFCMCPGGFVIPASTSCDAITVNGMSPSRRNSEWSNAAIVTECAPQDIPPRFSEEAARAGCPALSSLYWRAFIDKETHRHGSGQKAPAQRLTDFLNAKDSITLPQTSYTPGVIPSRLDLWLPQNISSRLRVAFQDFNKKMNGFITDDALLIASETRTGTPVRILRDPKTLECVSIKNLYPAGEGSGYSGGITSSAIDGDRIALAITASLLSSPH